VALGAPSVTVVATLLGGATVYAFQAARAVPGGVSDAGDLGLAFACQEDFASGVFPANSFGGGNAAWNGTAWVAVGGGFDSDVPALTSFDDGSGGGDQGHQASFLPQLPQNTASTGSRPPQS